MSRIATKRGFNFTEDIFSFLFYFWRHKTLEALFIWMTFFRNCHRIWKMYFYFYISSLKLTTFYFYLSSYFELYFLLNLSSFLSATILLNTFYTTCCTHSSAYGRFSSNVGSDVIELASSVVIQNQLFMIY